MSRQEETLTPRIKRIAKDALTRLPSHWRRVLAKTANEVAGDPRGEAVERALRPLKTRLAEVETELARRGAEGPRAQQTSAQLSSLEAEQAQRRAEHAAAPMFVPPGHYYSAIPALVEVRRHAEQLFDRSARTIPGVDLREAEQLELLNEFARYYAEQPFPRTKQTGTRYYFDNPAYSYSDALFLYSMIRHARPRRIVEVGSGFSSAAMLDTNQLFFDGAIDCTFIEPYPDLLHSLLSPTDKARVKILDMPLQEVPLEHFRALEANDILFIDSTHVSKIGSDVNRIIFELLPVLAPGVFIHFHDIFHPFEYPEAWISEGRTWQEAYLLRAFLQFNQRFRVVAFNTFLQEHHRAWFEQHMPLCLLNPGGSIWLQHVG
jgi:predicted O-methyltransferase YrrM